MPHSCPGGGWAQLELTDALHRDKANFRRGKSTSRLDCNYDIQLEQKIYLVHRGTKGRIASAIIQEGKIQLKCLNYFKKYTYLKSIMCLEPFAFSNRFFFKLHKNAAALPLSYVDRYLLCLCSLCLLSEGRNIGLKSGQKHEIQRLFWPFTLGVFREPP